VFYFIINAIFAGVIVIMTIVTAVRAIATKDPDSHYQAMPDDRVSFVKSQTNLETTELEALGKTARGESRQSFYSMLAKSDSRFNSSAGWHSASGFHSDTRFHSAHGLSPRRDEFEMGSQKPAKSYDADWVPFRGDSRSVTPVGPAKIRHMNAANNGAGFHHPQG
jgi:hypothetical protein